MTSRRDLLKAAAACSASGLLARYLPQASPAHAAYTLQVDTGKPLATIPENFTGLGYEMSSAARLGLLSRDNAAYLQLVRNLGARGVLRCGGIVADFTTYAGEVRTEPKDTVVTEASLQQLRGFLDACHWQAIWSLNFAHSSLGDSLLEARDVARILGPRLLAVELGNEVENYGKGRTPIRPAPYTYEAWRAEYTHWHRELVAAVPGLRFAAPDTAASVAWVERFAADAHGDVQLLTTHFYRGDQHQGTQAKLLTPDPVLADELARLHKASTQSGIPWRMCETNSFFGGGRPGVSNSFAGALWTLNYMLLLAQAGCAGVNMETGVNQLGFVSSYSPIQDDGAGHNTAGVPYYGMLAFALARQGAPNAFAVTLEPSSPELAAYALGSGGQVRCVVLINLSTAQQARVDLRALSARRLTAYRLSAPSAQSQRDITLGGAAVDADGRWNRASTAVSHEEIELPAASAVVLRAS